MEAESVEMEEAVPEAVAQVIEKLTT